MTDTKKTITKAIIPVAGYGTRRLPITKALEKCMLPIGNRPIVDFVVADCVMAGVQDIYFVVGEQSDQLMTYYGRNVWLEQYLRDQGRIDLLGIVAPRDDVTFHYVTQPQNDQYGTAFAVSLAIEKILAGGANDESVLVVGGDDFIYHSNGESEVAHLLADLGDAEAAMLAAKVDKNEVSKYGVIDANEDNVFRQIVEKPAVDEAPSNLINISKYVLPPKLLVMIRDYVKHTSVDGEYKITDPINDFVTDGGIMKVVAARGEYLDGGTLSGWLHANEVVGRDLLAGEEETA